MVTDVRDKIRAALVRLIKEDFYLLEVDINERSLTHRLAIYLEALFPNYHVDCEYNREGVDKKALHILKTNIKRNNEPNHIEPDDIDSSTVFPDITIHRRGTNDNFVVIEAKKSTTQNDRGDKEKLRLYKEELGYRHAFFVRIPVGDNFSQLNDDKISEYIEEIELEYSLVC